MSDTTGLENRITAALDRIGRGLDGLPAAGSGDPSAGAGEPGRVAELEAALTDERAANAQLQERVAAQHTRREDETAELRAELAHASDRLKTAEATAARLVSVNDTLRASNRALREAGTEGGADAALQESALAAELEALRAAREADRAELDALAAELAPLIEEENPHA